MRVLRSVVQVRSEDMLGRQESSTHRGHSRAPLVRHDSRRDRCSSSHGSPQEPQCGRLVASRLQQYVRHFAFCVDRAPEVVVAAGDLQKQFINVPDRKGSAPLPTHTAGLDWPKFHGPPMNRLDGHVDAALGQEFLNIAVAVR